MFIISQACLREDKAGRGDEQSKGTAGHIREIYRA